MMKTLRDDKGLTMAELLVVATLMLIVIAAVYALMGAVTKLADDSIARADATDASQTFIDRVGRELREAQEATENAGVFSSVGPRNATFYSDLNGDGIPERITYYVTGQSVYRTQASTSNTVEPFDTWGTDSAPQLVLKTISPSWSGAIFSYFTPDATTALTTPSTSIPSISRVDVMVVASAVSGSTTVVSTSTVSARIRSVQNKVGGN